VAIDHEKLMAMRIPETEQTYTERDSMLYALATGIGRRSPGRPGRPRRLSPGP
jgi:hypothetical protein